MGTGVRNALRIPPLCLKAVSVEAAVGGMLDPVCALACVGGRE